MDYKKWREQNNLTQRECARGCGVSISTWLNWENGVMQPCYENKIKLDKFLKGRKLT